MNLLRLCQSVFDAIPYSLVALFVRIVAAHPFFASGQTKVDGPQFGATILGQELSYTLPTSIKDSTFALFAQEYKVPLLSPEIAAYLATAAECVLPILLVLGLLTRTLRAGPSGDDARDPSLRLSRRLVDRARLLGGAAARAHRARPGRPRA